jgi:hypothetical protein
MLLLIYKYAHHAGCYSHALMTNAMLEISRYHNEVEVRKFEV